MTDETVKLFTGNSDRRISNLKPFRRGVSGNPSGRPKKIIDVVALARDSSTKAMGRLIELIDSDDERIALQASLAMLDRAMGKPKQTAEVPEKRDASDYTSAELLDIIRDSRAGAEPQEDGAGQPDLVEK